MNLTIAFTMLICIAILVYVRLRLDIALVRALGDEAIRPLSAGRLWRSLHLVWLQGTFEAIRVLWMRLVVLPIVRPSSPKRSLTSKDLQILRRVVLVQAAIRDMRQQQPHLHKALVAAQACESEEELRTLGYSSLGTFTDDYRISVEYLTHSLQGSGYSMPTSEQEQFEDRVSWDLIGQEVPEPTIEPPLRLIYSEIPDHDPGYVLCQALYLFRQRDQERIRELWYRFPDRRIEVEIAFVMICREVDVAPAVGPFARAWATLEEGNDVHRKVQDILSKVEVRRYEQIVTLPDPSSRSGSKHSPYNNSFVQTLTKIAASVAIILGLRSRDRRISGRAEQVSLAESIAKQAVSIPTVVPSILTAGGGIIGASLLIAVVGLGIVYNIDLTPPSSRASQSVTSSFGDSEGGMFSIQGIFDFETGTHKTSPKSEPVKPVEEKKQPEPGRTSPARELTQFANISAPRRELDIFPPSFDRREIPGFSRPQLENMSPTTSNYFGNRPDVQVQPREYYPLTSDQTSRLPNKFLEPGLPSQVQEKPIEELKDYRSIGRMGFSTFKTAHSLAGELSRLITIERFLFDLAAQRRFSFENAEISLQPKRAQVVFPDGVAFLITVDSGKDRIDFQVYLKKDIEQQVNTEDQILRGIQLLSRAISR